MLHTYTWSMKHLIQIVICSNICEHNLSNIWHENIMAFMYERASRNRASSVHPQTDGDAVQCLACRLTILAQTFYDYAILCESNPPGDINQSMKQLARRHIWVHICWENVSWVYRYRRCDSNTLCIQKTLQCWLGVLVDGRATSCRVASSRIICVSALSHLPSKLHV